MPKQPTEPSATDAPAKVPSPTISIAEPEPPRNRPYKTPPKLMSDDEVAALAPKRIDSKRMAEPPQMITDGLVVIKVEGDRITAQRVGDAEPANTMPAAPAPLSARALSRREIEAEAGRRAVARATEQLSHRPPLVRSPQEIAAEGTNTPVFRPGDFREYAEMRKSATSKDSGSSVLQRVQRTLPEG